MEIFPLKLPPIQFKPIEIDPEVLKMLGILGIGLSIVGAVGKIITDFILLDTQLRKLE